MTLQITPPPAARMTGIACLVTSTRPNTLVSKIARHASAGITSTGRLSLSTPALFTSTRRPSGRCMVEASFTSRRSTRSEVPGAGFVGQAAPSSGSRIVATTSKPRRASSIATARPIPRPAPRRRTATPLARRFPRTSLRAEHTRRPLVPSRHLDLRFTPEQERFRAEARRGSTDRLDGRFAAVRGRGGPGDEHECFDERGAWEQELGRDGWIGLGWPAEHGGRGASLVEQVIFFEEYARAGGPGRVGIIGEGLLGPTIVHFGSDAQRHAVLPGILARHRDLVPGLLRARRRLRPREREDARRARRRRVGHHRPEGLDVARALGPVDLRARAHQPRRPEAQGPLVPPRADAASPESRSARSCRSPALGVQRGVLRRRAHRGRRTSWAGSTTAGASRWARSRSSGARRRSASSSRSSRSSARSPSSRGPTAARRDPVLRQRLAEAWIELRVMRSTRSARCPRSSTARARRRRRSTSSSGPRCTAPSASSRSTCAARPASPGADEALRGLFLYSRADTIYGGSNQIQRNVIGERALGLPKEPK